MYEVAEEVEAIVPKEYWIDKNTGEPVLAREDAQMQILSQAGKLYILRGHHSFRKYYFEDLVSIRSPRNRQRHDEQLERATENYCIGLQYNSIFSPDDYAFRIVKNQIYENLRILRDEELQIVATVVKKFYQKYHIKHNVMEDFLKLRALWYGD